MVKAEHPVQAADAGASQCPPTAPLRHSRLGSLGLWMWGFVKIDCKIIPSWQFSSSIRSASNMKGLDALYLDFFFVFQCRTLCFLNLSSSPANSHELSSVMWLPFSPAPWSWEHKSQVITLICVACAQTYKIHTSSGRKKLRQSREISLCHIPLMPSTNLATFW